MPQSVDSRPLFLSHGRLRLPLPQLGRSFGSRRTGDREERESQESCTSWGDWMTSLFMLDIRAVRQPGSPSGKTRKAVPCTPDRAGRCAVYFAVCAGGGDHAGLYRRRGRNFCHATHFGPVEGGSGLGFRADFERMHRTLIAVF